MIVILSALASVVIVTLVPATKVRVSVALSATTLDCPLTAILSNKFCEVPPAMVIVFVAPVPDAVTPAPTKFKVVPAVDNALPSSCTVTPEPPPAMVIVFVAPVPDAVTPAPTKFKVVPVVDNALPSSCIVTPPPPPEPIPRLAGVIFFRIPPSFIKT